MPKKWQQALDPDTKNKSEIKTEQKASSGKSLKTEVKKNVQTAPVKAN
jgi:hypothetical protein